MRTHRRPVVILAATLAIAAPLLLSGCSLLHLPGSHSSGGGINIPGVGSVGSGKLPSDFPKDVPVITGDVVSGASLGTGDKKAWNATIKVDGVDAFDTITTELTGAGFTSQSEVGGKTDDGATGVFTGDKYDVAVIIAPGDTKGTWVANYTVTPATAATPQ